MLGDTTRLAVIEILMNGAKSVTEINTILDIDQSLLSHHLKILRDAELVSAVRDGKGMLYSLTEGVALPRSGKSINLGCCKLKFD